MVEMIHNTLQLNTTRHTQNICITFIQCWTNFEDVGPALYKCYTNVLYLLGSLYRFIQCVCVDLKWSVQQTPEIELLLV